MAENLFQLPEEWLPKKSDFKKALGSIYTARSGATHTGRHYSGAARVVTGPWVSWDALPELLNSAAGIIPPIGWFERVVNSAVTHFIERQAS